jgi:TM2 domain-containing membrane protein YozV
MSSQPLEPQTTTTPPPLSRPVPAATTALPKNPWLAVIFSLLFPGLGQVYNGELAKALVFFAGFVGSISLVAHGNPFPFAFFIPFILLFGLIDAWKGATAINQRFLGGVPVEEEKVSESPAWGITLVVMGIVFLAHNLGWLDFDKLARFWPLLLIVAGAFFIKGSIQKRKAEEGVGGDTRL